MDAITNTTNSKSFGTFKFQYSRHSPVHSDPRLVRPDNKKLAEKIVASFYCKFKTNKFNSIITDIEFCNDDSNKKPDVLITENAVRKGIQITQLQFTNHETRKALAIEFNKKIAVSVSSLVKFPIPVIVNIFPLVNKGSIPLQEIRKGKSKILSALTSYISELLSHNLPSLSSDLSPIWITVEHKLLKPHFSQIVLNPVPNNAYPRFYGHKNIYINYDINDTSYDLSDMNDAVEEIFKKKNNGSSAVLLIWADEQEIFLTKRPIAEKILNRFIDSSFSEVYFMTFQNNVALFEKSLELWPLKPYDHNPIS